MVWEKDNINTEQQINDFPSGNQAGLQSSFHDLLTSTYQLVENQQNQAHPPISAKQLKILETSAAPELISDPENI